MKPTWFRRRRRLWSIISFLAIVGFIFLLFQVFSLELLNSQQRQNAKKTIIEHELRDKDLKPSPLYDLNVGPQRDMDLVFEKELYKGKLRDKLKFNRTKYLNKHGVVNKDDVADDEKESLKNLLKDDIKVDHVDEEKLQKNTELKFEKDRKTEIKFGKQNLDKLVGVKPVLGVVKQSKTFFGDLKWISYGDEVHLRTEGAAPVGDDKNMVVLGVHPQKIGLYAPDKNGMFTCLESQEQLPFWQVNDDFCDCQDGTDEPGTAACPVNRFYCRFQLYETQPVSVMSSRVNDGICDCCDGSDEAQGFTLPDHVQLDIRERYYGVYQSPCVDHCAELRLEKQAREKLHEQGVELREKYLELGRSYHSTDGKYGPDGVFLMLSRNCYSARFDKYAYHICPWVRTEQEVHGQKTDIGSEPVWLSQSYKDGYRLEMRKGDPKQCPYHQQRKTVIRFDCGLEDRLVSVQEDNVCEYVATITTPAACA